MVTLRTALVSTLRAVTAAPVRAAPCSSVTLPRSVVVTFWARAAVPASSAANAIETAVRGNGGSLRSM